MSVGSELDVDMQDLVRVFTHGDGADLARTTPGSDAWADNAGDVMAELLTLGWLPPTLTSAAGQEVKRAWEATSDDEAFTALTSAAIIMGVTLVDPNTGATLPATLGKVA